MVGRKMGEEEVEFRITVYRDGSAKALLQVLCNVRRVVNYPEDIADDANSRRRSPMLEMRKETQWRTVKRRGE